MTINNEIKIRAYLENDAQALAEIYFHTIHNINRHDYSSEQINAWAPSASVEAAGWKKKWLQLKPIVAELNSQVVGFVEFESDGHIDCFYVHHLYQNQGIGNALLREVIRRADEANLKRIYAEVSITAKPFFERQGFKMITEQQVRLRGVTLTNFLMEMRRENN
jgi:putative acetyltransferase